MCDIFRCQRKATRIVQSVGLPYGKNKLCGYCCRSAVNHYTRNYSPKDVYESRSNENDWPEVGYDKRYLIVWSKI